MLYMYSLIHMRTLMYLGVQVAITGSMVVSDEQALQTLPIATFLGADRSAEYTEDWVDIGESHVVQAKHGRKQ